jgi:hypothetical protein
MENTKENYEMILKIWKKSNSIVIRYGKMEERQVEW